jgi:high-affinity nickel-transport protein
MEQDWRAVVQVAPLGTLLSLVLGFGWITWVALIAGLVITIDGSFMNFAYGWAFSKPVRKVYYNITITGLSVAVALIIGTIELLGLVANQIGWEGGFWDWIGGLDLIILGYVIVGLFVLTWVASLLIWRYARIEDKGATNIQPTFP